MSDGPYVIRRDGGKVILELTFKDHLKAQRNERALFQALQNGDFYRITQHNLNFETPYFTDNLSDIAALFPELSVRDFSYSDRPAYFEFRGSPKSDEEEECVFFMRIRNLLIDRGFKISEYHIREGLVSITFRYV